MSVTFRTPWHETIDMAAPPPDLMRRLFCWEHYAANHHYYVTDSAVACECGESYV